MTRTTAVPPHPAKYTPVIMAEIRQTLAEHAPTSPLFPVTVLDVFAGPGGIHQLEADGYATTGVELEPEWADAHPRTRVGDATALPFDPATFDVVCTSPCYGNRMADTYDGTRDRCTICGGDGVARAVAGNRLPDEPCEPCDGTGLRPSKRYTYTVALGRHPSDGSAAALQWGPEYRDLHRRAWAEAHRVLRPAGLLLLNISDHIRQFRPQGVDIWHANALGELGFTLLEQRAIATPRSKNGANRDARALCEWLLVFRKAR